MSRNFVRSALFAGVLLVSGSAQAADRDFKAVVNRLQERYHTKAKTFGFLGFLMRCFSPSGVSGLQMALFQDPQGASALEGDLGAYLRGVVEPGFRPFVQVRSNRTGHMAFIFAKEGKAGRMGLMIISTEPKQAVVMKMEIEPKIMAKWMDDPEGMAFGSGGARGQQPAATRCGQDPEGEY